MVQLNSRLDQIKSRHAQKKYTKIVQDYIEDEFSAELKKLTHTEGQILVKLIYRQTGVTAFDLVKDLKSGWRAFWYNTTASLFDISLKEEYHPENNEEDYLIEDILQRSFQSGVLEPQATALDFHYLELTDKWHNSIPVLSSIWAFPRRWRSAGLSAVSFAGRNSIRIYNGVRREVEIPRILTMF